MKLNCLTCGHKVDLDDAYSDFEGQVKCFVCDSILEIKTEEGYFKSIKLAYVPSNKMEETIAVPPQKNPTGVKLKKARQIRY